jgi:hypothetical protein
VPVAILLVGSWIAAPARASAASYDSLPIGPISPADGLAGVPDHDAQALTFGDPPTGALLVVGLENYRLWSRRSIDGGASFGAETPIDAVEVHELQGRHAADGKLYLAYVVSDPAGGLGVRVIQSDDLGATWSQPQAVIHDGMPGFPVSSVALATGPAGSVAVIVSGAAGRHPYVSFRSNPGAMWTTPVRVDPGSSSAIPLGEIDVAVDSVSRIHAAYVQDRGLGTGPRIYRTRSLDAGLTFAAEVEILVPFDAAATGLDLESAQDGNMLLALSNSDDATLDSRVYVLRSTNGGSTYAVQWSRLDSPSIPGISWQPRLVIDPGTATTFVHARPPTGGLLLWRSLDAGATWPAVPITVTGSVAYLQSRGEPQMRRLAPANTGWLIAWTDWRTDSYAGRIRGLYARSSFDDGATFAPEMRIDNPPPLGNGNPTLRGMAPVVLGYASVTWTDGGFQNTRSDDVYVDRFSLSTPTFGADTRVDVDGGFVTPESDPIAAVATDGASHVYHAFAANTTGPYADLWVAASADQGRTFAAPRRIGGPVAGAQIANLPQLRAFADGRVYVLYFLDFIPERQIRFNRSLDFGANWSPADVLIDTYAPFNDFLDVTGFAALADGTVYVVWSTQDNIYFVKSTNGGASFPPATTIEQGGNGFAIVPEICASGDRVIVTFQAWSGFAFTWYAVVSEDRGATWLPRFALRDPELPGVDYYPTTSSSLACGPGGTASFVWRDLRSGEPQLFSSRFTGTSWTADTPVATPAGSSPTWPSAAFSTGSTGAAIVAYESGAGEIHVSRSVDGGAVYSSFTRLDGTAPDPAAWSHTVRAVGDGSGSVWVRFMDRSGGLDTIVSRASVDDGLTWGAQRRLSGEQPAASRNHAVGSRNFILGDAAAAAGNAYFVWGGQRESHFLDPLLNTWDADDLDRDGEASATDCDDTDPALQLPAPVVAGVAATKVPGLMATRVSWQTGNQDAGTTYDVVGGLLTSLHSSGGFTSALCQSNDQLGDHYDDAYIPPAGDAKYYLIRANNACGPGSFGNSSLVSDPRDALDLAVCM